MSADLVCVTARASAPLSAAELQPGDVVFAVADPEMPLVLAAGVRVELPAGSRLVQQLSALAQRLDRVEDAGALRARR